MPWMYGRIKFGKKFKSPLPSIIMGNVISLANEKEELLALMRTQQKYLECSIMYFTKKWRQAHIQKKKLVSFGARERTEKCDQSAKNNNNNALNYNRSSLPCSLGNKRII